MSHTDYVRVLCMRVKNIKNSFRIDGLKSGPVILNVQDFACCAYRMRQLRIHANMTQKQVAEALGTSQAQYSRYERQAADIPVSILLRACKLFGVSSDYMLGQSPDMHRTASELAADEPNLFTNMRQRVPRQRKNPKAE